MKIHLMDGSGASGTELGSADYGLIPRILQLDRKGMNTHLVPMTLNPFGLGTRSHTSFLVN